MSLVAFSQGLGQPIITFPVGNPSQMDGKFQPNEWNDAAIVEISINANETVKVLYKASMDTLYFAFTGRLESGNIRFPEISFNTGHEKSITWDENDRWFHVSATDCDHTGAPGVYTDCAVEQDDWLAVPNFNQGLPVTDTVEIAIPITKLHLTSKDTFGIAFNVSNTFSFWKFWPDDAQLDQPSTWATACISQTTSEDHWLMPDESGFQIYPNPNQGLFTITGPHPFSDVRLYDLQGRLLKNLSTSDKARELVADLTPFNLPQGVYLVCIDQVFRPLYIIH